MDSEKLSFTVYDTNDGEHGSHKRKRILENQDCEICGDKSTGKHYGVFSCDGCSGFFKRTCHRTEPFICKGRGDCKVDKSSRNDCKACRLQKCLQSGMNVDGVQGRALRKSKKIGLIVGHQIKNEVISIGDDGQAEWKPCTNHKAVAKEEDTLSKIPASSRFSLQSDGGSDRTGLIPTSDSVTSHELAVSQESPQHLPLAPLGTVAPTQLKEHPIYPSSSITAPNCLLSPVSRAPLKFHMATECETRDREQWRVFQTESSESSSLRKVIELTKQTQPGVSQSSVILPHVKSPKPCGETVRYRIVPNIPLQSSENSKNKSIPFLSVNGHASSKEAVLSKSLYSVPALTPPLSSLHGLVRAIEPVQIESSGTIQESVTRLLSSSLRFARQALCIGRISLRDQIILMEESWKGMFVLAAAFWELPLEVGPLLNSENVSQDAATTRMKLDVARGFQDLLTRIRSLQLDSTEFACLKAIVLFTSETKGLKAAEVVEKVQDDIQVLLGDYIRSKKPQQPQRFGKLLITLSLVRRLADRPLESVFFNSSEGNELFETLLSQMVTVS